MKLDLKIRIYYNSATSQMKEGNTGQRRKLSTLYKKSAKQPPSGSPLVGRKARQRHHQGFDLPDHPQPGGARYPSCHWGGLGSRRSGYAAKIFWVYGQQYKGKNDEFGIYCPDCWQIAASAEVKWGCQFLKSAATGFRLFYFSCQCNEDVIDRSKIGFSYRWTFSA